jgi:transcriptional regulator with XRE-family HTH domain
MPPGKNGVHADMADNRIKQLRLDRGLSLQQLAEKIGVSESHLSRVEAGLRGLHLSKIEALANVLGLTVGEVLSNELMGYLPDLEPYTPPKGSAIEKALTSSTQKMFKVLTGVMSELEIARGDPIIADLKPLKTLKTGEVVVARLYPKGSKDGVLLLREYISPNLLITNSLEQNALPIHMLKLKVEIIGCVLR